MELDGIAIPEGFVALRNENYPKAVDFSNGVRRQILFPDDGIEALFGPLSDSYGTQAGLLKVRFLLFDATKWPHESACRDWADAHKGALKFAGGGEGPRVLTGLKQVEVAIHKAFGPLPDEKDLAIIHSYAIDPLESADYYVRRMNLCNTMIDRASERFTTGNLRQFRSSIIGKSVLEGHNYQTVPLGRFYRADTEKDGKGVVHLQPAFFMVREGNEAATAAIDSGVWKHTSIGFYHEGVQCDICGNDYMDASACAHIAGQWYGEEDVRSRGHPEELQRDGTQTLCSVNYGPGKVEAVEGSIVWLGCQYDAEIVKAYAPPSDIHGLKAFAVRGTPITSLPKYPTMDATEKLGEDAPPASEDTDTGAQLQKGGDPVSEAKLAELEAALEAKTAESDAQGVELAGLKEAVTAAETSAQSTAEAVESYKAPVVERLRWLAEQLGKQPDLSTIETMSDGFAKADAETLLRLVADWEAKYETTLPPRRQGSDSDDKPGGIDQGDKGTEQPTESSPRDAQHARHSRL